MLLKAVGEKTHSLSSPVYLPFLGKGKIKGAYYYDKI
jgi:hypothetical protein